MDVSVLQAAAAKGCPLCKGEGWIEILGCGMVHPKVLEMMRHRPGMNTPASPSAWAWSVWLCGRFKIDDIRLFYENDVRFLHQF